MLSSTRHSEAQDSLVPSMYPYCPDDEVREFLYGVRTEKMYLPKMSTTRTTSSIWVGHNSTESALTESVNKIFKCSWPDIFSEEASPRLDLPASLEDFADVIANLRWHNPGNPAYEFYPIQVIQESNDGPDSAAAAITRFRLALCTHFDVQDSLQISPWTDICNSIMESVWHHDLKGAHVNVSFRPRWSLYPTTRSEPGEWPVIVPDVVFSAVIPVADSPRLLEALPYHPAYVFSDQSTEYQTLEIPILIVEYGKINLLQDDQAPRPLAHREHLEAAIAAALPMYSVLGLKTPMYGVYIDDHSQTGESCAGSIAEMYGVTMPVIDDIAVEPEGPFDFNGDLLHILHLQSIIANLRESASRIRDEIRKDMSLGLKPNVCPVDGDLRCAANRPVVDTQRPPVVVHDETLQYLFSLNPEDVVRWISEAEITIANNTTLEPPQEIKDFMRLFVEPEGLPEAWIRKVVADCFKGLSDSALSLASEFIATYRYTSTSSSMPVPDSLKAVLDYDVRASLTICSHASDLYEIPVNGLNPHSASSHWSVIYNSLFMRAIQKPRREGLSVFFETYPRWQLHKKLHSFSAVETEELRTLSPEDIRPSCALSYKLFSDHIITRAFPPDRDAHDVQYLGPELTVNRVAGELWQVFSVDIPLMVGEYVLMPGDSNERDKHLAHLAMTMRSALALWEIHCLKGPVVGFLMERNIVETKLGWIDDDGKCVIRDVSEYRFDLLHPCDTFRLHNFVKVFGSQSFGNALKEEVDTHATMAMQRMLDSSYRTWREIV